MQIICYKNSYFPQDLKCRIEDQNQFFNLPLLAHHLHKSFGLVLLNRWYDLFLEGHFVLEDSLAFFVVATADQDGGGFVVFSADNGGAGPAYAAGF